MKAGCRPATHTHVAVRPTAPAFPPHNRGLLIKPPPPASSSSHHPTSHVYRLPAAAPAPHPLPVPLHVVFASLVPYPGVPVPASSHRRLLAVASPVQPPVSADGSSSIVSGVPRHCHAEPRLLFSLYRSCCRRHPNRCLDPCPHALVWALDVQPVRCSTSSLGVRSVDQVSSQRVALLQRPPSSSP